MEAKEVVEELKTKKVTKEVVEETIYTHWAYCNLIGASSSVKFVANLKFKNTSPKTEKEWKEIFEKEELI